MIDGVPDPGYTDDFDSKSFPPRSCEELQRAEDWIVHNSVDIKDPRKLGLCAALEGWQLYVHPTVSWVDLFGRRVGGLTFCNAKGINIGNEAFTRGSLAHEFYHVMQDCKPRHSDDPLDSADGHEAWFADGIYDAIGRTVSLPPDAGWP